MKRITLFLLLTIGMMVITCDLLHAQKSQIRRELFYWGRTTDGFMILSYHAFEDVLIDSLSEIKHYQTKQLPDQKAKINVKHAENVYPWIVDKLISQPGKPVYQENYQGREHKTKTYSGFMWLTVSGIRSDSSYYVYLPETNMVEPFVMKSNYSEFAVWVLFAWWSLFVIIAGTVLFFIYKKPPTSSVLVEIHHVPGARAESS